jgi:hypothetical protein
LSAVARIESFGSETGFVMLDFDANENVVGIEVVGQQEFSIRDLIKQIPMEATGAVLTSDSLPGRQVAWFRAEWRTFWLPPEIA